MKNKNIYIIRHGETDFNKKNMVQGRGVDSSLNEKGIKQATAFYETYKSVNFDKVYTSSLKRTMESVGQFIKGGIPTESLPGLDEISWGSHEGQPYDALRHGKYLEGLEEWKNGNIDHRVGEGESLVEVAERQKVAMKYILEQTQEETILIATHGRALRILLCWLEERPLEECDAYEHSNLCLYKLSYDGKKINIQSANNTDHLN